MDEFFMDIAVTITVIIIFGLIGVVIASWFIKN